MKIGALFYGTGALDLAVTQTWGGEVTWLAENDKGIARIASVHQPQAVNIGDVTRVRWSSVPKVDVITGGSPCQDLSLAGRKKGLAEGTRSNLWVEMREAISVIRPSLVVWENVRGAYTVEARSDVEFCPRCVGDPRGVHLRALGRVLGDLADLGYDARWHGLSAAEVGAAHNRFRVVLLAYPKGAAPPLPLDTGPIFDGGRQGQAGPKFAVRQGALLPTPTVVDMGDNKTIEQWETWCDEVDAVHHNGNGHGNSLEIEVKRYERRGHWGKYEPVIKRWERLTRLAPVALKHNPKIDAGQVTPQFVEWMMGLPQGWVSGVPGMERKTALRALGNGAVPQQMRTAFRVMCDWE